MTKQRQIALPLAPPKCVQGKGPAKGFGLCVPTLSEDGRTYCFRCGVTW